MPQPPRRREAGGRTGDRAGSRLGALRVEENLQSSIAKTYGSGRDFDWPCGPSPATIGGKRTGIWGWFKSRRPVARHKMKRSREATIFHQRSLVNAGGRFRCIAAGIAFACAAVMGGNACAAGEYPQQAVRMYVP